MSPPGPERLLDHLLDAIFVVDPGDRIVAVRGACERIFGYTPAEMAGRQFIDFLHPDDVAVTLRAADRVKQGFLQRNFTNRYLRKDGRVVRIMWTARLSPEDGLRVAVARDVTEEAAAEAPPDGQQVEPCWRLSASPARLFPPGPHAPIPLSPNDYKVLAALASGAPVVTRDAIVAALGADALLYDRRRLDTQMRRLRRKVEQACGLALPVRTVRNAGFQVYQPLELRR